MKAKDRSRLKKTVVDEYILENVVTHASNIANLAASHFKVSQQAINRHLNRLINDGKIAKTGTRKATKYSLVTSKYCWKFDLRQLPLDEHQIWDQTVNPHVKEFSANARSILVFCFTEMVNNVIDHSSAKAIIIEFDLEPKSPFIRLVIYDNGIGIFRKIKDAFNLDDERESILELTKGKITTDPARHSGEGIFFTSRMADKFSVASGQYVFTRHNRESDWFIDDRSSADDGEGTIIVIELDKSTTRTTEDTFKLYTDPETLTFSKTHVFVKLAKLEEETYVSRSQAKRLMSGLQKFKHVILDFEKVRSVGQGFVDEVFRIFKTENPDIRLESINMNDNVKFMITRGINIAKEAEK
jgi:anti-sigma regulatory factor (Ser/Thr protein kinase)